ncbi:sodium:solute symporter family protein [Pyramidobacter sp. C12-8]|nr:sodium:proline symporter [Pyramidobacter sp. C12-8]OON89793.1 sodium:proline symporter [Pyramidobacter sp. C12-8]
MTGLTVAGIVLVLALIIGVGLYSGRRVRNAKDFLTGGGKAGPGLVCGALMGSLVSSQSTLGSVQLAFHYGLAAWWFTLGSGLGCLLMALGYAKALRNSGCVTELQIISGEYGGTVESVGSVLSATGIFITVLSQVMGCIGLFTLMFPSMSVTTAAMLAVLVMCCYVIFGGAWGAGMGGVVKVTLLYLSLMGGMVLILRFEGGLGGLTASLERLLGGTPLGLVQQAANNVPNLTGAADISRRFMNLTARGTMKDLGSCVSLLLGVLSTQTYAQAVWSGRTDSDARKGVLLSAFLIPPLGIAGVLMGLSMRAHYLTAAEAAALAAVGQAVPDLPVLASTLHVMPAFAMDHLPPILAGVVLGTLLITVIGGGAGLSLGMATILVKDIYKRFWPRLCTPAGELLATRLTIAVVLIVAAVLSIVIPNKTLNDFGFLSMALRGAVVFAPMTCALALKGRIRSGFILAAIVFAPAAVAAGHFFELPGDPLLTGMGVSVGGCLLGLLFPPHKR